MKSLEDLKKLRDKAVKNVDMRLKENGMRIAVGMATCGIAAGARPILNRFVEVVGEKNLKDVIVTQVGCIGECAFEPIVEIFDKNGTKTTYCQVTEKMVDEIIEEHVLNDRRIDKYMLSEKK